MISEVWLPIAGWEGRYAVSDLGRVKSLPRVTVRQGFPMKLKGKILSPGTTAQGYQLVVLSSPALTKPMCVHALVATAFISRPPEATEVDHRSRDRSDNAATNLRWATRSQNNGNAVHGRGASKFRGVVRGQNGRWAAQMGNRGRHIFLGEFPSEEDAARAYNAEALRYFGDFARLNFPITEGTAP